MGAAGEFAPGWRARQRACGFRQRFVPAVEQAAFVIAVGLLAGAVFVYIRERNLLAPLAAVTPMLAGFAAARVLLWPDSLPLRVALEVSYRIILLTAAIALLRARRGPLGSLARGSGIVSAAAAPQLAALYRPGSGCELCGRLDVLLGLSMLLVVFGEARARTRRLRVLQALTDSIVAALNSKAA